MKAIEKTPFRNDLLIAIVAGIQIVLILAWTAWPLRIKDVITALVWAVILGVASTVAWLKRTGTIQVRTLSAEDAEHNDKRRTALMIATVITILLAWTWMLR
jgi:uncharacterized membrane protein